MSWTVPPDPLYSWIFPSAPTGTMTRFGMFCPAWKFRFDVSCWGVPDGHTVMYPAAAGPATVTFRATADTPVAGTPPCPVTCTEIDPVAGTGPDAPWPIRVSESAPAAAGPPRRVRSVTHQCGNSRFDFDELQAWLLK